MSLHVSYGQAVTEPPAPFGDTPASPDGSVAVDGAPAPVGFQVKLTNFSGPFDVLLELIGKHKLDVTEVALHTVTDDFIAYIRAMGDAWDLDETSEFLVIAATLLDLKAARLLPSASVEDEEDLALLEARDLLFARLLQYKAFKEAALHIAGLEAIGSRRYPRAVSLEPQYAEALPDLVLGVGPDRLLKLAVRALTPKPLPVVSIAHIHMVRVSVREHAGILRERLLQLRVATFQALCADVESTLEVVARFLALLELYRENLVEFEQVQALEELTVRWIGADDAGATIEVEEYEGVPEPAPSGPPALSVVEADVLGPDEDPGADPVVAVLGLDDDPGADAVPGLDAVADVDEDAGTPDDGEAEAGGPVVEAGLGGVDVGTSDDVGTEAVDGPDGDVPVVLVADDGLLRAGTVRDLASEDRGEVAAVEGGRGVEDSDE